MSESKFKTMRHIETVRNFINVFITELFKRQEQHDQSKLQNPEVFIFDEFTPKLRDCTYGSDEYKQYMKEMKPALDHHYSHNQHHPEHFKNGICQMNLIDILEMLADWKAATLRHANGDIYQSLEINQKRFGYSDEFKQILKNTVDWLENKNCFNVANES